MASAGLASTPVDEELIALLLQQDAWEPLPLPEPDSTTNPVEAKKRADAIYLRDNVLPTLVPALHDLLDLVERERELGATARATSRCVSREHPTGASGPIEWLAQYLVRNNTKRCDALHSHPYVVLHRAAKLQQADQDAPPNGVAS